MSDVTIVQALKPCPFCSGIADLERSFSGGPYALCGECGSATMFAETAEVASALWNTRQASTEDLQHRLGMIVSHATSGHTDGAGMSVNDICVEISRTRNHVYQAGKDVSAKATDDLVEALRGLEPYLDAIVCFASTQGEHEPNRLVANARTALNKAGAL